jgi:hypothetical protein
MDKDLHTMYKAIGRCVEATGRMLASNKKSYWSLEDTKIAEATLTNCTNSLKIMNEIRLSRISSEESA